MDGKPYTMQYFERAVFEFHPDAPAGYRIMLSLLGSLRYHDRYEAVEQSAALAVGARARPRAHDGADTAQRHLRHRRPERLAADPHTR